MPPVSTYTTHEPMSIDIDIKNTTDGKELYEWSDTSEINPIKEIVELHTIDENENNLSSFEIELFSFYGRKSIIWCVSKHWFWHFDMW